MWCFFFFNDTAPTETSTLPLPAALPIPSPAASSASKSSPTPPHPVNPSSEPAFIAPVDSEVHHASLIPRPRPAAPVRRSEEHTSELQSRQYLVCRLLLEKKKQLLYLRAC